MGTTHVGLSFCTVTIINIILSDSDFVKTMNTLNNMTTNYLTESTSKIMDAYV